MGSFKKLIGEKIRERRKVMGFKTQEALAIAIDADRTRVSRWESGENLPDPIYKAALATALGVSESFFEDAPVPSATAPENQILERLESIETRLAQQPTDAEVERALAGKAKISQYGDDLWEVLTNMDPARAGAIRAALRLPKLLPEKGADSRDVLNAPSGNQRNDEQVRLKKSPAG